MKKALLIPALLLPLTGCQLVGDQGQARLGETVAIVGGQPAYTSELDSLLGNIQHRGMSGDVSHDRILQELINRVTVAIVSGQPIYTSELDHLLGVIQHPGMNSEVLHERILQELINRVLLRQNKLDAKTYTAPRLYSQRRAALPQTARQNFPAANPPTDEALKKEYDQRTQTRETEYKVRHILVKTEDEAKEIIGRLNRGEAFDKLAKAKSLDPNSSLDWVDPQKMVEPFAKAVMALENGEYTEAPVQTQFGWHVILREDTRTRPPHGES